MKYEPKMIYNPSSSEKEFMCGGETYIFAPGEKRILEGYVADHLLKRWAGLGLVDYTEDLKRKEKPTEEQEKQTTETDYSGLPWKKLHALGGARGIFKPGMKKEELLKLLKESDEQERTI